MASAPDLLLDPKLPDTFPGAIRALHGLDELQPRCRSISLAMPIVKLNIIMRHSYRSATMGSTRIARRTGGYVASRATPRNKRETPARELPSTTLIPKRRRRAR